jgi:hypothetical protein
MLLFLQQVRVELGTDLGMLLSDERCKFRQKDDGFVFDKVK